MSNHRYHDLKVVHRATTSLTPYAGNARQHPRKQIAKLAEQILAVGWINPIIADEDNMILAGHGRLEAAKKAGLITVPVINVHGLTKAEKISYVLSDNRMGDESTFSKQQLRVELEGLIDLGANLDLTGFTTLEIETTLSIGDDDAATRDDNIVLPDDGTKPVSRRGDLWHIGVHKALCEDSRDLANYARLLGDERAELVFSDPPYNTRIKNNVSGLGRVKHQDFIMGAGELSMDDFSKTLLRPVFECMAAYSAPGAIGFICSDWRAYPHMLAAAEGVFHEQKNLVTWIKTNAGMGQFYRSAHELIPVFKITPGPTRNNFGLGSGGRHRSNVWTYAGANTFRKGRMEDLADHSTVKPKKLVADAIRDCSQIGGIVLDSFLGSGTTLVSCAMTGRVGRGLELDPKYVDVILKRVEAETGCEPLLDGVTPFSVVAAERRGEEA